jgi:hypothetical protein
MSNEKSLDIDTRSDLKKIQNIKLLRWKKLIDYEKSYIVYI